MFNVFKKTEYVQYSPDLEKLHPNETALIDETAQHIKSLILQNFNKHSHAYRGTHLKTQVYNVIMRYANEPFKIDPDTTPGPRGVGMKIFLDRDITQDILMNNAPILELTDVETTRDIFAIRDKYFEDQEGIEQELKKRDTKKQMAPFQLPNTDIMGMQFFQQAPFRFGPYIGKFSLVPSKSQYAKTHGKVPKNASPTILREWIEEYYRDNDAEYTLSVQLCENVETEPIEDTSVEWKTTFHELADIVFPKQEAFSPKRRVFWEEKMRLDPWAGMEEHKPVGGVNRVRRGVYGKSREQRQDLNRTQTEAVAWEDIPE